MKINSRKEWVKDLFLYAFLAILVLIKFWNFLIPKDKFYWIGDFLEVIPMRDYFYHHLKQGTLILWNSHIAGGMPYLAADYGAFYPIDFLIGILFPNFFDPYRLSIVHAFHFWLGGVFTYLYTRQMGLSRSPALLSSICFMLGGFLLGHAGHRNVIQTFIWLPLILYFLDKALMRQKVYGAALAGLFLAISFLAGHANFFYFILLFLSFYFLFRVYLGIRERSFKHIAGDTFYFLIMGFFCLGISAIQLLPILFTSLNTHHGSLPFEWKAQFAFPLLNLVHFLIPDYTQWTATDVGEQYGYIGLLPLIFAFWGIFHSKDPRIKFFGLVALFSFIASLGELTPLYKILYKFLPGLKQFRVPARFNALIIFPLAILSGFGFQYFLEDREHRKAVVKSFKTLLYFSFLAGISVLLIMLFILSQDSKDPFFGPWSLLKKDFFWFLLLWGISYLLISLRNRNLTSEFLIISFVLFISLNLIFLGRIDGAYSKTNPALISTQSQKVLKEIKKDPSPFRVNNYQGLLPLLYQQPDGFSVYDAGNFLGYVGMVVPQEYLEILFSSEENPMLLDLLDVKYYVGSKPNTHNGLKIWKIGGEFGNKELELKNSTRISHLAIISYLSHSTSIPQGTIVAQVKLVKKDGSTQIVPIRAGIETAEWAIERPGLKCSHQKAQIKESWEIGKEGYQGQSYFFTTDFPKPIEVSNIRLQYLSRQGSLLIKKIFINGGEVEGLLKEHFQFIAPNIYKNPSCLPRVFMIGKAKAFIGEKELMEQMEQLDPRETILLSQLPTGYHEPVNPSFSDQEASIIQYLPDRITIMTKAREDKFLVLSDTYNPFWKATIDQKPSPILKVDYGLRGLYVPKGAHRIVFSFYFYPFYCGLTITCASLLVFFFLSFGVIRRNYRQGEKHSDGL